METNIYKAYIEKLKPQMLADLAKLVSIPSKNAPAEDGCPFGREVNDALSFVVKRAAEMGFEARNLGYCAEVKYGKGSERIDVAAHVDVVPEGDGWSTEPFTLTEKDGVLYGRGVLDDKGAAIGALYSIKAMKDAGHIPNKEIRLLFGGAEEMGMEDLKRYIAENGLPDFALSPDSGFPVTNAELGVVFGRLVFGNPCRTERVNLKSMTGGNAYNCVPDKCFAEFVCDSELSYKTFLEYLNSDPDCFKNLKLELDETTLSVKTYNEGVSVHGSVPEKGRNAVKDMIFCIAEIFDRIGVENFFVETVRELLIGTQGRGLGIYCSDTMSGEISVNVGICRYTDISYENYVTLDIRVPVSVDVNEIRKKIEEKCAGKGIRFDLHQVDKGTYMSPDNEYLKILSECYERVTGKKAEMLCSRGVTYAKSFEGRGVAFGPIEEDGCEGGKLHSADEFIKKDAFFRNAEIYAEVLHGLT